MSSNSPAQLYAALFGAALLVAGIFGFFYEPTFWDNVMHIATGLLGLLAFAAGAVASRRYAFGFGAVYVAVAIWGLVIGDGDSILSIIPVNTQDNVLHLMIGFFGLAAGAASSTVEKPRVGTPAVGSRSVRYRSRRHTSSSRR
jgi:hypothetical protein